MMEPTEFGRLVADGSVNELFESHQKNLSWAGTFSLEDIYVSEDGPFVNIVRQPTEAATDENKALDFSRLTVVLFHKYFHHNGEMMPPYLGEFIDRAAQLMNHNGRDLLISLWVLRNHPFVMDPDKWRVFLEDYYKWYKATDIEMCTQLLIDTNRGICHNWHLNIVPTNVRLSTVYWDGWNPNVQLNEDNAHMYPFTTEDAYLAIYHRVGFVHGPQILQDDISLKELAFLIANYFNDFLPRFIEEIFTFAEHEALPAMERKLLEEALVAYTKRRSSSWRHHLRKLYEVEEISPLHI